MAVQLEVTRKVALRNGIARLELTPVQAAAPRPAPAPRPSLEEIQSCPVHESRLPLTRQVMQSGHGAEAAWLADLTHKGLDS